MKKQATSLYILRLSLTLLAITAVVAALLAGVNAITKDRIAAINAQKTQQAIAQVLPSTDSLEKVPLDGNTDPIIKAVYLSEVYDGGCLAVCSYAVEVHPSGFGGEIAMMVGVTEDGNVLGISIISHTETAGLGAVAAANNSKGQAFRDQFVGLSGTLAVTKDGGTIDALSSATITSRAVTEGVNAALAWVAQRTGKEAGI